MQKTLIKSLLLIIAFTFALSANYIFAVWTGPTQAPHGGNTPTPIHVGQTPQLKAGTLALNALVVYYNSFFGGNVGIGTVSPSTGGEQDLKLDVEGAIGAKFYCDENGNNCASAPLGGGGGLSFGSWETKAINTTYKATSDGFVVTANTPPSGDHYGYTDGNSNPTTLRTMNDAWGDGEGIMMPVRSGDYWRVYQPSPEYGTSNNVYWLPVVSGGGGGDGQIIEANTVYHAYQDQTINFTSTFTAPPVVVVTTEAGGGSYCFIRSGTITTSSFQVACQNDGGQYFPGDLNYIAIGQ